MPSQSWEHVLTVVEHNVQTATNVSIQFVHMSSFDNASRSSNVSVGVVGTGRGLEMLKELEKEFFNCPLLTNVHTTGKCQSDSEVVNILQNPELLCRQEDLLLAVGEAGVATIVKIGQVLVPWDMKNNLDRIELVGNGRPLRCEWKTSFGYNALIGEFRARQIKAETGYAIVMNATQLVEQTGDGGTASGGERKFATQLARAAVAAGCGDLFIGTHQSPDSARSDGSSMINVLALVKLPIDLKPIGGINE